MRGYVYFCQGQRSGLVKIGWAVNPESRVGGFRCGSSEELELLHTIPGDRLLEAAYHRVWAHVRVRGEWFWPVPDLMAHIARPDLGRYFPGDADVLERLRAGEHIEGIDGPAVCPLHGRKVVPV